MALPTSVPLPSSRPFVNGLESGSSDPVYGGNGGLSSDLGSFRSWRTPVTGTVGSISSGSPLGSPDPIEEDLEDRLLGFCGYGRQVPVFIGEIPVPAHRPKKSRSWFLAIGLAVPRVPVPDESEGLRFLKKASGIGMPGVSFMMGSDGVSFMVPAGSGCLGCRHWILFLMASLRVVGALFVVGYPQCRRWHRLRLPRPWVCGALMLRLCSIDAVLSPACQLDHCFTPTGRYPIWIGLLFGFGFD